MSSGEYFNDPQPAPPTVTCWICLETGNDSNDQPLLRNCACRGDAGWAHVSCLADYAGRNVDDARNKDPTCSMIDYWIECPICKSLYVQNMAVAMAKACCKHYQELPEMSEPRMTSRQNMASTLFDVGQFDEALKIYLQLLDTCAQKEAKLGMDMRSKRAGILGGLAPVYMKKLQLDKACDCLKEDIEIQEELLGPHHTTIQYKRNTLIQLQGMLQSRFPGGASGSSGPRDAAAQQANARKMYKKQREYYKDDPRNRIGMGISLVMALKANDEHQEAVELLESMAAEAKLVLGPDHPDTIRYESDAKDYRKKLTFGFYKMRDQFRKHQNNKENDQHHVWAQISTTTLPSYNGKTVQVLKAIANEKYVVLLKKGVMDRQNSKFKPII